MNGVWSRSLPAVEPALLERRLAIARATLTRRAYHGLFVYFLLSLGYCIVVWGNGLHAGVLGCSGALLALGAVRRVLLARAERSPETSYASWRRGFGALALASVAVWDALTAYELWTRGIDTVSFVLIIASAGIHANATHSLAPDLRVQRVYSLVSRAAVLIALLFVGGRIGCVVFAFLSVQTAHGLYFGRQLNEEFWRAVATTESLEREIEARQRVEVERRLAQKLESLGRMAAGIAHELNTPLQTASGNLAFLAEGVPELVRYARAGRAALPSADLDELEYLGENLPSAIDVMLQSLERTAKIVRSIRSFAHPAATRMEPTDLNRELENTVALAAPQLRAIADLQLELGALPAVRCHAGELNQVFAHLLANAAHAIEAAGKARGRIAVSTRRDGDRAVIAIADDGCGIAPDIRHRIYDPFFTTRAVGAGSGEGLAVARAVVTKHGGEISFATEVGRGTTFTITLPLAA